MPRARAASGRVRGGVADDALVIGAGHNGLVAANLLADAGWRVRVLEAQDTPGGAVRSTTPWGDGFVVDLFSAFYPFGAASPVLRSLQLEHWGLRWAHAPHVLAHLLPDDRAAVLSRNLEETAASVDELGRGDGRTWRALTEQWGEIGPDLLDALLSPFPPVLPGLRLLRGTGVAEALRLARLAVTPVRQLDRELFAGPGATMLFAGNAGHSDLSPAEAGSGVFGWLLCMLGQTVGFPVPVGGSGELTGALVRRLEARGGTVECGARVDRVLLDDNRASGVQLADARTLPAAYAVLADVDAPTLYSRLVGEEHLPSRVRRDLRRFAWDPSTLKLDWALSGPIPWTNPAVRLAGTVHLGVDLDGLVDFNEDLQRGRMPADPFLVLGQMTTCDPTRSPAGTASVWCYTHVPRSLAYDRDALAAQVERVEAMLERHAPGFRDLVVHRLVQTPADLEASDANLVRGAINGGTAKIHQELVFRPIPGLGRAETPVPGLYLAGASAHPGGGVHGGPGANAARAALLHAQGRTAVPAAALRLAGDLLWRRG